MYSINGYKNVDNFRADKRGGGVSLLVKDNMNFSRRKDLDILSTEVESVFIELDKKEVTGNKNVIIGVIYRPPNSNLDTFFEYMNVVLEKKKKENKLCYLLGDYNIDLLKTETHTKTGEFIDLMFASHFVPLINKPTRVSEKSATYAY